MSMNWLKIDKSTPDKPEVYQIAAIVDIDPELVFTKLVRMWAWFDDHTTDGNAPGVIKSLLDRITGVTGFVDAVVSVGWAREENGYLSMSGFEKHTSASAKKRAQGAARQAKSRESQASDSNAESNASSVTKTLPDEDEDKSLNKIKKSKKRTAMPEQFDLPQEWRDLAVRYAATKQIPFNPEEQFEQFCNHHRAKGSLFVCWKSAWGTWYQNAAKFYGERNAASKPTYQQGAGQRLSATERQQQEIESMRAKLRREIEGQPELPN